MTFDVFKLRELPVAQTALFQGHVGVEGATVFFRDLAMPSSVVNYWRSVFELCTKGVKVPEGTRSVCSD